MGATHELYNKLYRASNNNQFDKTELYKIISSENIDDKDGDGCTLLHLAASRGDLELVTFLLSNNADITILDNGNWSVLRFAIEAITENNFAVQDAVIKSLIQRNANIDEIEEEICYTALHNAATSGDVIKVQVLVANDANLSAETFHHKTPRKIAEESNYPEKARMLELFDTPVSTVKALTSCHSIFSSRNQLTNNDKASNQVVALESSSHQFPDSEQPREDNSEKFNSPKN